ncbi:hypothetical protein NPIL_444021 [Nephila pilipes]|uniref:Uncharacterized protein n=1 Tax=Nephila pilipes TaxID=299642 RepID=A0A8X6T623_NEPPI|nr:hypothetical protein NPIL_444021 [Nephila pilipes]
MVKTESFMPRNSQDFLVLESQFRLKFSYWTLEAVACNIVRHTKFSPSLFRVEPAGVSSCTASAPATDLSPGTPHVAPSPLSTAAFPSTPLTIASLLLLRFH